MEILKKTDNLTFTLNYGDGETKTVEEGVLFSVQDEQMDIHIGTDRKEVLFTVAKCLTDFITDIGLEKEFEVYIMQDPEKEEKKQDKEVLSLAEVDMSGLDMPVIAIYGPNQIEYPGKYVARIFNLVSPTNVVVIRNSLEELQEHIRHNMPSVLLGVFLHRGEDDDPSLVGCWI